MPKLTTQEAAGRLINYAFRLDHNDIKAIGNGGLFSLYIHPPPLPPPYDFKYR